MNSIAHKMAHQRTLGQHSRRGSPREHVELVTYSGIDAIGEPRWVIDHILPDEAVSMLYGPSGKGKTFQGLDWAFCINTGHTWHGNAVRQGPVVYVAGEGASGYGVRVHAWERKHGIKPESFVLCTTPIRLWPDDNSVQSFIKAVNAEGIHPVLVVFDTLSKALGGADEKSNGDMRTLLDNAERIVRAWHCAVLLVHHTPKRSTKGERESDVRERDVPRGAQTLQDGVAMHAYLDGDGQTYAKLTCTKQKDTERFKPIKRTLCMVTLDNKASSLCFAEAYKTGARDATKRRISWDDIRTVMEASGVRMWPKDIAPRLDADRKAIQNHLTTALKRGELLSPTDAGYALNPAYMRSTGLERPEVPGKWVAA